MEELYKELDSICDKLAEDDTDTENAVIVLFGCANENVPSITFVQGKLRNLLAMLIVSMRKDTSFRKLIETACSAVKLESLKDEINVIPITSNQRKS